MSKDRIVLACSGGPGTSVAIGRIAEDAFDQSLAQGFVERWGVLAAQRDQRCSR